MYEKWATKLSDRLQATEETEILFGQREEEESPRNLTVNTSPGTSQKHSTENFAGLTYQGIPKGSMLRNTLHREPVREDFLDKHAGHTLLPKKNAMTIHGGLALKSHGYIDTCQGTATYIEH